MAALVQDFTNWVNIVTLVARVTSEAQQFELPSGDTLRKFQRLRQLNDNWDTRSRLTQAT